MSKLSAFRLPISNVVVLDEKPETLERLAGIVAASYPDAHVWSVRSAGEARQTLERVQPQILIASEAIVRSERLLDKAGTLWPNTAVILVAPAVSLTWAASALSEGVVASFLIHPVRPETLVEALNAAFLRHRAKKAAARALTGRPGIMASPMRG